MKDIEDSTSEERLQIVRECLENDKNYGAMSIKYNYPYHQVRNWVKKYEEMGFSGLSDRHHHNINISYRKLQNRIEELERKNKDLQIENDLLKNIWKLKS